MSWRAPTGSRCGSSTAGASPARSSARTRASIWPWSEIEGAANLPTLTLGDANRLRVGEFVMALGHPFGLEHSVSFGIVSRKGSPLTVAAPGFDFIQTDATINPGNSGGPLVNMAGEVVGVNTMAARNGSIGFAIPSNLVSVLVPQLASQGQGRVGVARGEHHRGQRRGRRAPEAGRGQGRAGARRDAGRARRPGRRQGQRRPSSPSTAPRSTARATCSAWSRRRRSASGSGSSSLREGEQKELEVEIGLYKERAERPSR